MVVLLSRSTSIANQIAESHSYAGYKSPDLGGGEACHTKMPLPYIQMQLNQTTRDQEEKDGEKRGKSARTIAARSSVHAIRN
jgi:hypothetical protein